MLTKFKSKTFPNNSIKLDIIEDLLDEYGVFTGKTKFREKRPSFKKMTNFTLKLKNKSREKNILKVNEKKYILFKLVCFELEYLINCHPKPPFVNKYRLEEFDSALEEFFDDWSDITKDFSSSLKTSARIHMNLMRTITEDFLEQCKKKMNQKKKK